MVELLDGGRQASGCFEVMDFDCDCNRALSPWALLRYAQEVADAHLDQMGMPYTKLLEAKTIFLLAGVQVKLLRPPQMHERFRAVTWQRTIVRAQYIRDTEFLSDSGEVLALCTANWFLVDPDTHRIRRPKDLPLYQTIPSYEKALSEEERITVHCPEEMQPAGVRRVRYSDMDYNHHLNNTRYAEFLCDFAPGGMQGQRLQEFKLVFSGEAVEGDEIEIFTALQGKRVIMRGRHARGRCFEASFTCCAAE